ncbi:MAG: hypothetical protein ACI9VR_003328 [Cognaticolwellia sp.]
MPEPDLKALEEQADRGLTQLPGCFEVQGEVLVSYRVEGVIRDTERFGFTGQVEDGVWIQLVPTLVDPGKTNSSIGFGEMPFLPPMYGVLGDGVVSAEGPGNVLALIIAGTRDEVGIITASLDTVGTTEVYVFQEEFDARQGRGKVAQYVWITPEGIVRHAKLSVANARTENGVKVRALHAVQFMDEDGKPTNEAMGLKLRAGPIWMYLTQELSYTSWIPCS